MTLAEMQQHVWDHMPTLQRLAGRRLVDRVVRRAVSSWPVAVLEQCDEAQGAVVGQHYGRSTERAVRGEMQIGILAMFLLSAVVQVVVRMLIEWWFEHSEHRRAMRAMVREARDD